MKSGACQKYDVMSLEEIQALPVNSIADANSMLFMWVTVPFLEEAFSVIKCWGFTYKTALFWHKLRFGTGFWFRGCIEVLLVCIRGHVTPFRSSIENFIETQDDMSGFYSSKPEKHSKKPESVQMMLESIASNYSLNPKVELFARQKKEGWVTWGNEL